MKFVVTTDRDGKTWVLNTAHIVAVTTRSGHGGDWSEGAWINLTADSQVSDAIALGEKEAVALLQALR